MLDIIIREATQNDLKSLQIFLPSDIPGFHKEVLAEFKKQETLWLLVFSEGNQIGHARIRWNGSRTEKIRQHVTNTPNIEAFGIKENFRLQGIGSKLLSEIEKSIKNKGHKQAGLTMGTNNNELKKYYSNRGYVDWKNGTFVSEWDEKDSDGNIQKKTEEYTYLIKQLK